MVDLVSKLRFLTQKENQHLNNLSVSLCLKEGFLVTFGVKFYKLF